MLIRVEMDVEPEGWFGIRLVMPETKSPHGAIGKQPEISSVLSGASSSKALHRRSDSFSVEGSVTHGTASKALHRSFENFSVESSADDGAVRETMHYSLESPSIEETAAVTLSSDALCHPYKQHLRAIFHPLRSLMQLHRNRKEKKRAKEYEYALEQENKRLRAEREEVLAGVETAMGKLSAAIRDLTGDFRDCYCVYDDSVRKGLLGKADDIKADASEVSQEQLLPVLWSKCFPVEEFGGYRQQFWVEQLLSKATWPHFLILGTASCVFAVIEQCAVRMKSLRWILPEEDYGEDVLDFVEDFYTEYGLAIALQPVESWTKKNPAGLRRLRLAYDFPINVIDFTEEVHGAVSEMAEGSIWLDMCSVEEKKRRIMSRNGCITYISLKEKWKQAQRFQPFIP